MERGLAANTVQSYRRDLRRYASALAGRGKTGLSEVAPADVAEFLASLREGDAEHGALAVSSAARALIAVRGLHACAVAQGLAGTDPRLLRDRALLEFLYGTGARVSARDRS